MLERRLQQTGDWLVGHRYTTADLANYCWINFAFWAGVEIKDFPTLKAWADRIEARAATTRGLNVPKEFTLKKQYEEDPDKTVAYAAKSSKWIMKGQEGDAKK